MRTIKFRAWDNDSKKMLTPKFDLQSLIEGEDYATLKGCEIMQFTGLLDKNGKEIYEGDICKLPHGKAYLVKWFDGDSMFGLEEIKGIGIGMIVPDKEVIGNIWEHPELLK